MQKSKKIFTVFMVLAILVSSHAFAYYEHTCLITHKKAYSFEPETCAGKSSSEKTKEPQIKRQSCCELHLKVQKVDDGLEHSFKIPFGSILATIEILPIFNFSSFVVSFQNLSLEYFGDFSPPSPKVYLLNDQFLI